MWASVSTTHMLFKTPAALRKGRWKDYKSWQLGSWEMLSSGLNTAAALTSSLPMGLHLYRASVLAGKLFTVGGFWEKDHFAFRVWPLIGLLVCTWRLGHSLACGQH